METYLKHVEFLAGRLKYDPATKKVSPDPRRGRLLAYHDRNDEKHVKWFDLDNNNKEELDRYVFAGDARFNKVVKSTGRVYLLDFELDTEKYFFWIQEPDASKDAELEKKFKEVLNLQPIEEEEVPSMQEEEQSLLSQQSSSNNQNVPAAQNNNPNQADQQRIQQMNNQLAQALMQMASNMNKKPRRESPLLSEVLNSKFTDSVAEDPEYREALIPLLPDDQQTPEGLRENLKSPQFLQALETLEHALASEEGAAVLMSMGLDANFFYQTYDGVDALYNALIKYGKEGGEK